MSPKAGERSGEPTYLYQVDLSNPSHPHVRAYPCRRTKMSYIFDDTLGPGHRRTISAPDVERGGRLSMGALPVGRTYAEALERAIKQRDTQRHNYQFLAHEAEDDVTLMKAIPSMKEPT